MNGNGVTGNEAVGLEVAPRSTSDSADYLLHPSTSGLRIKSAIAAVLPVVKTGFADAPEGHISENLALPAMGFRNFVDAQVARSVGDDGLQARPWIESYPGGVFLNISPVS